MKFYKLKYSGICKILLCLFLTVGCNLSIEGHFWPNNILPYIFLVLNGTAVFCLDFDELTGCIVQYRVRLICIFITVAAVLAQAVILRIYMADSIVVLIKAGIKVFMAGIATGIICIMVLLKMSGRHLSENQTPENINISFMIFGLLELIYFYLIRRITDGFSIYPILIFILIYLAKKNTEKTEAVKFKGKVITYVGALLLALFETLGYMALMYWDFHGSFFKWLGLAAFGSLVWTFIFYYVCSVLFILLDNIMQNLEKSSNGLDERLIIALFTAMIVIRCLYWMNWFPALLSKDTYVQIQQALGNEAYSNHHPWLHTMIIKFFMNIGNLVFGSNQAGVALTAAASIIVSSVLSLFILKYFYCKTSKTLWWFAALVFVVEPIHCVYSITIWKDVLFAYALVAFCFLLMAMDEQIKRQGRVKPYMWLLYVVISFVFCFSRTNGLYAWFFTLPFLLWHYRKNLKPWIISCVACMLLIIGYKGWLLPHFQVTEPDMVEALSVPLQQVAFTIQNNGSFSEYDISVINNIVDMDAMGERYNAHISDPVKNLIRDYGSQEFITQNKLDFIKMYISVGIKNPTDYIVAFLNQSRGYWYQKMSNYIYFSEGVHRYAAELGIYRSPLFTVGVSTLLDKLMDKYCDIWHNFWSLALSTYVVFILFIYSLSRKKTCFYFLPVIGVFITLVIATPVNDEFRYAYGIYLALPLLVMNVCSKKEV